MGEGWDRGPGGESTSLALKLVTVNATNRQVWKGPVVFFVLSLLTSLQRVSPSYSKGKQALHAPGRSEK